MASSQPFFRNLRWMCIVALIACSLSQVIVNAEDAKLQNASNAEEYLKVKRADFSSDFVFGVSTAAIQIEGSASSGGKGPSIWDNFVKKFPERMEGLEGHADMFSAADSYKRYKEDVKLIKDLGVDSYRFSISWTRILPNGSLSGGINQEGIDHYNSLIDELVKNEITPFVTLLHFDPPQALEDKYGGPLNRSFVDDFKDYSEICFKTFGDRVKNWITINEPFIIAMMGYDLGQAAPGRCSDSPNPRIKCTVGNSSTEPYIVSHNLLLAHATAVKLYREKFQANQSGQIGLSLVGQYVEPFSNSTEDKAATKRLLDFNLGWYMEPLVYGDYPKSMRVLVKGRLPSFSNEDKNLIKGAFDFIGINYYTARYGKNDATGLTKPSYHADSLAQPLETNANGDLIGPLAGGSNMFYIYPQGLQKLLEFMKENYQSPKIYITENGMSEPRDTKGGLDALKDPQRIENTLRHLYWLNKAIKNGVNVKGYIHWALLDDFSLEVGYSVRFGLYYVDFKDNLKRVPKDSAKWFLKFLKGEV